MGTKGGARNLGRDDIGEIAPGFAADFVAWRTDAIGFAGGQVDPIGALIFCTPSIGYVDLSVINGDIIVQDGKLQTLDLKVHSCNLATQCAILLPSAMSPIIRIGSPDVCNSSTVGAPAVCI